MQKYGVIFFLSAYWLDAHIIAASATVRKNVQEANEKKGNLRNYFLKHTWISKDFG